MSSSSSSSDSLKAIALLVLGGIAALALFPYASGKAYRLEEPALYIAIGCAIAIVLVILSDRITSLKVTRDSFEMQLESIRGALQDTINDVKGVIAVEDPRILRAEQLVRKPLEQDLIKEAKDIGAAMRMLREVMRAYKRGDVESEN